MWNTPDSCNRIQRSHFNWAYLHLRDVLYKAEITTICGYSLATFNFSKAIPVFTGLHVPQVFLGQLLDWNFITFTELSGFRKTWMPYLSTPWLVSNTMWFSTGCILSLMLRLTSSSSSRPLGISWKIKYLKLKQRACYVGGGGDDSSYHWLRNTNLAAPLVDPSRPISTN